MLVNYFSNSYWIVGASLKKATYGDVTKLPGQEVDIIVETECPRSCADIPDGLYQSCLACERFMICAKGKMYDVYTCPWGRVWDDNLKDCEENSTTCSIRVVPRTEAPPTTTTELPTTEETTFAETTVVEMTTTAYEPTTEEALTTLRSATTIAALITTEGTQLDTTIVVVTTPEEVTTQSELITSEEPITEENLLDTTTMVFTTPEKVTTQSEFKTTEGGPLDTTTIVAATTEESTTQLELTTDEGMVTLELTTEPDVTALDTTTQTSTTTSSPPTPITPPRSTTPSTTPKPGDVECIKDCWGRLDGDYQSCLGCHVYASCFGQQMFDNRPCPYGLYWDDNFKECVGKSSTCFDFWCGSHEHWQPIVVMPSLSSLAAPQVVMPTCDATSDDKVGLIRTDSCHDVNFFATGGTIGCHPENRVCHKWRQSGHHYDSPYPLLTLYVLSHCPKSLYYICVFCHFSILRWCR